MTDITNKLHELWIVAPNRRVEDTLKEAEVEIERLRALVKDPAMCGVELSEENDCLIDERDRLRDEVKQLREELEMWKNSHSPA